MEEVASQRVKSAHGDDGALSEVARGIGQELKGVGHHNLTYAELREESRKKERMAVSAGREGGYDNCGMEHAETEKAGDAEETYFVDDSLPVVHPFFAEGIGAFGPCDISVRTPN